MAWKSDLLRDDMQVRLFICFICSSYILSLASFNMIGSTATITGYA